ncbi:RHS repeat-associated core domain-containing protein [Streptomyces radiopugnans]|uniref:RHS repeat-associated core domain-containing protein n=1 Tax=Streptomyces radiopugnans TaxID=403935 RepID=UPI003F1C480F
MTSRTVDGVTSELDWNGQNRVSRITQKKADGDEVSTYVYDVSGNVLMRSSANEKVLYLDGHELRASAATTAAQATRYYSAGDTVVAMRTPSDTEEDGVLVWLMSDGQASTQLMILAATGVVTRRRYTPFGDQRGEASLPAGTDRGFLGKPEDDATGLSILGARMYDAALGRFLSPDELITPYDPQNLSSYSYSVNNPVAYMDPSGLGLDCGRDGVPCPTRPDGSPGNGRPNEAVDYNRQAPEPYFGEELDKETYERFQEWGYTRSKNFTKDEYVDFHAAMSGDDAEEFKQYVDCRAKGKASQDCLSSNPIMDHFSDNADTYDALNGLFTTIGTAALGRAAYCAAATAGLGPSHVELSRGLLRGLCLSPLW